MAQLKPFNELSIRFGSNGLEILDQRKLPDEEVWLPSNDVETMWQHIKQLSVRGAPLIGVAAAMAIAVAAKNGKFANKLNFHTADCQRML